MTSFPWKWIWPLPGSACSSPAMMRSSVVFPEPDGPSSATSLPRGTCKSTLSSAVNAPNFFEILETWILIRKGTSNVELRTLNAELNESSFGIFLSRFDARDENADKFVRLLQQWIDSLRFLHQRHAFDEPKPPQRFAELFSESFSL